MKNQCECADPECPVHHGKSTCTFQAETIIYRSDMTDETGTAMCHDCAEDAMDTGLFTDEADEQEDEDEDFDSCAQCGEPNTGGEGYDGLCGNCADKAERKRT